MSLDPLAHLATPANCNTSGLTDADAAEILAEISDVLASLYPNEPDCEQRDGPRYPYPYLVQLTPVAADGKTPVGEAVVVVGKYLSEKGLGFYHPSPLPYRQVIATLTTPDGEEKRLMLDLSWCRFTEQGWYESGGRFLEVIYPSMACWADGFDSL